MVWGLFNFFFRNDAFLSYTVIGYTKASLTQNK